MIIENNPKEKEAVEAAPLFAGFGQKLLLPCLTGSMGQVYTDKIERPSGAAAVLGDFCFLAGVPSRELIRRECAIFVPQNEMWEELLSQCFGKKVRKVSRYAMRAPRKGFDRGHLQRIAENIPEGCRMRKMDEELFRRCQREAWSRDWVSQYGSYERYCQYGMGEVILRYGEVVSGASSYAGCRGGIEIQIDTREEYRRQGLALNCGAQLVLDCLERGWYPGWDAQTAASRALAEKLGYETDFSYHAYEICGA